MSSSSSNRHLFSYHTSNVYVDDAATLKSGVWLNDAVIAWFMDYLQHDVHGASGSRFRFISPGTTFILMHEKDEEDFADSFEGCECTSETQLMFFPINNNLNVTKMGGSHWTLLVLDLRTTSTIKPSFYYYDSTSRSSQPPAAVKEFARKLTPVVMKIFAGSKNEITVAPQTRIPSTVPQQTNSSDCGVFTLAVSEIIASAITSASTVGTSLPIDSPEMDAQLKKLDTQAIAKKRDESMELIKKFTASKGKSITKQAATASPSSSSSSASSAASAAAASSSSVTSSSSTVVTAPTLVWELIDGTNNSYRLYSNHRFVYRPITPIESCSGSYSGGDPIDEIIDAGLFNEINTLWTGLMQPEHEGHDTGRAIKGISTLRKYEADGTSRSVKINIRTYKGTEKLKGPSSSASDSTSAAVNSSSTL